MLNESSSKFRLTLLEISFELSNVNKERNSSNFACVTFEQYCSPPSTTKNFLQQFCLFHLLSAPHWIQKHSMKLLYICFRFCTFQYRFSQPQIVALLQLPVLMFQPVYTGSPPPVYNPLPLPTGLSMVFYGMFHYRYFFYRFSWPPWERLRRVKPKNSSPESW